MKERTFLPPFFFKKKEKTFWSHFDEILHEKWILNFKKHKTQKSKIGTRKHFNTSALLKKKASTGIYIAYKRTTL